MSMTPDGGIDAATRHAANADSRNTAVDGGQFWGNERGAHAAPTRRMPYTTLEFRTEIARVRRKRRLVATLCAIAAVVVALVIALAFVFKVPQSLHTVNTSDMVPALSEGQVVLTREVDAPNSGDIIAYRDESGSEQFGRVLTVAGEWANISSDGSVVVSEVSLEGSKSDAVVNAGQSIVVSRQTPNASCFVVSDRLMDADHLVAALDHPVSYRSIIGRVAYRIWPLVA